MIDLTRRQAGLGLLAGAAGLAGCAGRDDWPVERGFSDLRWPLRPLIIAHRGASAERPEHTLAAYALAVAQGADVIEPDLVMTRDGVLVCRHEPEIGETTDVADHPEFADRRTTKVVDGAPVTGWFCEDFTLSELKTLRCRERLPQIRPANTAYDGQEAIPTFAEMLALVREGFAERGRLGALPACGVIPELKHPAYLQAQGLDPIAALVRTLQENAALLDGMDVWVQCFEVEPLRTLAQISSIRIQTVQLIAAEGGPADRPDLTYADMLSDAGLAEIATYAQAIGPEKTLIVPRDAEGRRAEPTDLVDRAVRADLSCFPWTFRPENYFLPADLRRSEDPTAPGNGIAELEQMFRLGVRGAFTDSPAVGIAAVVYAIAAPPSASSESPNDRSA